METKANHEEFTQAIVSYIVLAILFLLGCMIPAN